MVESAFIDARAREKLLRSKNQRVEQNFKSANFETYLEIYFEMGTSTGLQRISLATFKCLPEVCSENQEIIIVNM